MNPPDLAHPVDTRRLASTGGMSKCISRNLELNYENEEFLPANIVAQLTTREMIKSELSHYRKGHELLWLTDYVLGQPTRSSTLFLILTKCEKLEWLWQFAQDGFCDGDLPVQSTKGSIRSVNSGSPPFRPKDWILFESWSSNDAIDFCTTQWIFMAPVFTMAKFHHGVNKKAPLPFMKKVDHGLEGNFSSVYEVEVHEAHQKVLFTDGKILRAAWKVMRSSDDSWNQERDALGIIRNISHRHLIKPIASFAIGAGEKTGSFLFPWADGGSLAKFWDGETFQLGAAKPNDMRLMKWILKQIAGLCGALEAIHQKRGRHGDIKPENILMFLEENADSPLGTLHIADVGLGRFHPNATSVRKGRNQKTKTNASTVRYAPPEFVQNSGQVIPRSHDIWSFGCVIIEFLIWAMRGSSGLEEFFVCETKHFGSDEIGSPTLHPVVEAWLSHLRSAVAGQDEQSSAIGDLLDLVANKMMVAEDTRISCSDLCQQLDKVLERAQSDQKYLLDPDLWTRLSKMKPPCIRPIHLPVPESNRGERITGLPSEQMDLTGGTRSHDIPSIGSSDGSPGVARGLGVPIVRSERQGKQEYYVSQLKDLEDKWESRADKAFARNLFRKQGWPLPLAVPSLNELCKQCAGIDFWQQGFTIRLRLPQLMERSKHCHLCRLLAERIAVSQQGSTDEVELRRIESGIRLGPNGATILSLYVDPQHAKIVPEFAQIGSPNLPKTGSKEQYALMDAWMNACISTHGHSVRQTEPLKNSRALLDNQPTRVIDVGSVGSPTLRLVQGSEMITPDYLALSHCWGDDEKSHFGRTVPDNYHERRLAINPKDLPLNFKDAIEVARGLGVRYLWIDSICIIQLDREDWNRESVRMEQVYSNAKCVLAASSAASSTEGFLRPAREPRDFATVRSASGVTTFVCKNIDDFQCDIEMSVLNTRGWVLQERALARRTIHFAANQMYFECGEGVQCESLMKLTNGNSAILADSDFPTSVEKFYDGGRIVLIQNLFKRYSTLSFNKYEDRPIAISGLEKRLATAFRTRGGYGIFEQYLKRNLLWQRADGSSLSPIKFPPERNVPSWSWMAYAGGISYVSVDFDKVNWSEDLRSPFDSGSGALGKRHWEANGSNKLPIIPVSRARKLSTTLSEVELRVRIRFDIEYTSPSPQHEGLRCVVIGKHKLGSEGGDLPCYVLIVKALSGQQGRGRAYRRLGAGELLENHIDWDACERGELY